MTNNPQRYQRTLVIPAGITHSPRPPILLNGSTAVRTRGSEGCAVLPCGCAHTDVLWLQMCAEHFDPWSREHTDALRYHRSLTHET